MALRVLRADLMFSKSFSYRTFQVDKSLFHPKVEVSAIPAVQNPDRSVLLPCVCGELTFEVVGDYHIHRLRDLAFESFIKIK